MASAPGNNRPLKPDPRTAIVVGASSGIGAALARTLVRKGYKVALVARRREALEEAASKLNREGQPARALVYPHDVTNFAEVPALFDRIVTDLHGCGVIVYCSGVMANLEDTEYDFGKDHQMIAVNFSGAVAWLNEAAGLFTRLKTGAIVGVGSVAGDRGRQGNTVYGATKAALHCYLESLRNRLNPYNVRVITIKPGPVATDMTAGLGNLPFMISADEAAREIMLSIEHDGSSTKYVPRRWRPIMTIIRHIPSVIFRRLTI